MYLHISFSIMCRYTSRNDLKTHPEYGILYLRFLGFTVTNDVFRENAWYFRNAMVRANYTNLQKGVHETTDYLELFLRNLLLGEEHPLQNRTMHIRNALSKQYNEDDKQYIQGGKQYIFQQYISRVSFSCGVTYCVS